MTREDIIRMAREAGFDLEMWQLSLGCNAGGTHEELERFAALVAAAEREACAKVCEGLIPNSSRQSHLAAVWDVATFDCAAAIRARGNT